MLICILSRHRIILLTADIMGEGIIDEKCYEKSAVYVATML